MQRQISPHIFSGRTFGRTQFIESIGRKDREQIPVGSSYYQAWKAGELTLEDLQVYVVQYYFFEANFPRYLSCLSSCGD
jgi:pyrroloquinoline quinone (PQQ) biosynthesis protein C